MTINSQYKIGKMELVESIKYHSYIIDIFRTWRIRGDIERGYHFNPIAESYLYINSNKKKEVFRGIHYECTKNCAEEKAKRKINFYLKEGKPKQEIRKKCEELGIEWDLNKRRKLKIPHPPEVEKACRLIEKYFGLFSDESIRDVYQIKDVYSIISELKDKGVQLSWVKTVSAVSPDIKKLNLKETLKLQLFSYLNRLAIPNCKKKDLLPAKPESGGKRKLIK